MKSIVRITRYKNPKHARWAVELLKAAGIPAATDPKDLGRPELIVKEKGHLFVLYKDEERARKILELAHRLARPGSDQPMTLPPEEGTMGFLDMLIHDSRQYLMIDRGEIQDISEEGALAMEEPTQDLSKITIRLKRLKRECMRMAGKAGLDWEKGGGLPAWGTLPEDKALLKKNPARRKNKRR